MALRCITGRSCRSRSRRRRSRARCAKSSTASADRRRRPDDTHPREGSAVNILIAEDDQVSRLLLQDVLKKLGHTVTATADGAAAKQELERRHFPLVISDW